MKAALAALALSFALGCSQAAPSGNETPAPAPPPVPTVATTTTESTTRGPVIATLATHDGKISIVGHGSASQDLRVVVRKADGTLVADGLTLDELAERDPASYALVKNATVGVGGGTLDATGPTGRAPKPGAILDIR